MKRLFALLALLPMLVLPVKAEPIQWVTFRPKAEAMEIALDADIETHGGKNHLSWIDILALAACRSAGACPADAVTQAVKDLRTGDSLRSILGERYQFYEYYHQAFQAILGGLVGNYAVHRDGKWTRSYGLKAYSPIAAGYSYSHVPDYGAARSYGFQRPHLGNDLMGELGTPIVAVESGFVEALGWNPYGGWRVGIRSFDGKRYYYYAHMRKDTPYAPGLKEGDLVQAGDLLGFMGRTGYSQEENVNNIQWEHLHLGLQLVFEEDQKNCDREIWIDVYELVRFLNSHRSTIEKEKRVFPYWDLDLETRPDLHPLHPSFSAGNSSWRSLETASESSPAYADSASAISSSGPCPATWEAASA